MLFNPAFQPFPLQDLPEDFATLLKSCPTQHSPQESIIPGTKSSHGDYPVDTILPWDGSELVDPLIPSDRNCLYPNNCSAPDCPCPPMDKPVVKKGRRRKYAHLAHLDAEEYRKAANRLHVADSIKRHRASLRQGEAVIEIAGDHSVEMGFKLENKYPRADDEYEPIWVAYDAWRALCVNRDQLVNQFRAVLSEHNTLEQKALDDLNGVLKEQER